MTSGSLIPVQSHSGVRVYRLDRPARRANPLRQLQRFLRRRNAR
jgi:hypothetical protein